MKKASKRSYLATSLKAIVHSSGNYRYLLFTTALIVGGAGLRLPQVLAQVAGSGTAAGTSISNTATATYQDPNNPDPNARLNAISNTVTVQVAEVSGITITGNGIAEAPNAVNPVPTQNNGTIDTGDIVYFNYTITNVGNDPTRFFIPGAPAATTGATFDANVRPIQIVAVNGTNIGPIDVPGTGANTDTLAALPNGGSFAPGQTLTIRVPVQVTADTSGAPIRVLFGNPGANQPPAQNQPYVNNGNDVYTVDSPNGTVITVNGVPVNEVEGAPINSQQEASAAQETFLSAASKAFATVLKTSGAFAVINPGPNGTLTYNLGLRVASTSPDASFTAADLQGTRITINGSSADNRILISDVIPSNSTLTTPVATGTLPANWTVVYSGSDPTNTTALTAQWRTDPAVALADSGAASRIQRVGFVYDAGANGAIARGANLTGFQFSVTTNVASTGGTVANIAQVFGQTDPTIDPLNPRPLVYDESGDTQPNNYNDDNTSGPFSNVTPAQFNANNPGTGQTVSDPNQFRGIATPATQGVDNSNTNTGQGPGGENNVFAVQPTASILNGPLGQPAAVGPTSNNDDFTNKATDLPANPAPNTTFDPVEVVFTNTVNNPSSTATLTNILLRPLNLPASDYALLPNGTTVRITLGNNTGLYTYNSANGQFTLSAGTPISIPTLSSNVSLNYETRINLPGNTPLSTDINRGFSVPIVAFIDDNGNGAYNPIDINGVGDRGNITINRLYTGFLKLIKSARILNSAGTELVSFTTQSSALNPFLLPGNTIEYQIQFKNISEPSNGTGNAVLNAGNVIITENGSAGTNNWFSTPTSPTRDSVFPSNPNGSATTTTGTLSITVNNNDIQIYENNAGTLVPSGPSTSDVTTGVMTNSTGTFTFRRIIN